MNLIHTQSSSLWGFWELALIHSLLCLAILSFESGNSRKHETNIGWSISETLSLVTSSEIFWIALWISQTSTAKYIFCSYICIDDVFWRWFRVLMIRKQQRKRHRKVSQATKVTQVYIVNISFGRSAKRVKFIFESDILRFDFFHSFYFNR